MNGYFLLVILMTLSAGFAYVNHRFIKMPFVIGLFFLSTLLSLVILTGRFWDFEHYAKIREVINNMDLSGIILDVLLAFLLFAGSLHTNWGEVKSQIKSIAIFALGGVIVSALIVAALLYEGCALLGVPIDFIYCLIFGALISPTDPIAILGILTKANVPQKIKSIVVGESLFNDGVGVVLFIALLETLNSATGGFNITHFGILFVQEAAGGIGFGFVLGYALHALLRSIDNYETEVLLTIAFVMGGYALCNYIHLSGALAMVVMGLMVGNYHYHQAMSDRTEEYVLKFWEIIDVILNAILFISIALVLVVVEFHTTYFLVGLMVIPIALFSRWVIVYLPMMSRLVAITSKEGKLIVWGGLRGGLSLAMVLSLPVSETKPLLLVATYTCVVFSILIQGLTIEKLARRLGR